MDLGLTMTLNIVHRTNSHHRQPQSQPQEAIDREIWRNGRWMMMMMVVVQGRDNNEGDETGGYSKREGRVSERDKGCTIDR